MNINEKSSFLCKEFPSDVKYFKLEGINHDICLQNDKSDIEKICEIYINPSIRNIKLIKTNNGTSNEGQYISGNKLIVEVALEEKLLYVSDRTDQRILASQYEVLKSTCVILPKYINHKRVEELYKSSRLSVIPYILHTSATKIDNNSVNVSTLLFLDVQSC